MTKDPAELSSDSDVKLAPITKTEHGQDLNDYIGPNRVQDEIPQRILDLKRDFKFDSDHQNENISHFYDLTNQYGYESSSGMPKSTKNAKIIDIWNCKTKDLFNISEKC